MVEAHNLAYELGSLGDDVLVDGLVDGLKAETEGLVQVADPVQLGVMGTHNRAVIAEELFATVAEEFERFVVQHTALILSHVSVRSELKEWGLSIDVHGGEPTREVSFKQSVVQVFGRDSLRWVVSLL